MIEVTLRIDSCHECPYCIRTNIWYTYNMSCGSKDMNLIALDVSYNEEIEPPLWCPYRKENRYV